jgi:hypothetical protein
MCLIDFNLNDTARSLMAFLNRLATSYGPLEQNSAGVYRDGTDIDLRRCKYIGPDAAAYVAAMVLSHRRTHNRCAVTLPTEPASLVNYCRYVGLTDLVNTGVVRDLDHPDSETVSLRQVHEPSISEADRFVRLIDRHEFGYGESDEAEYLRIAVAEVLQNVTDHANSPIGCITTGRYFSSKRQFRMAFVDLGVSIPVKVRKTFPTLGTDAACLRAVHAGDYSSRSRENNMGQGVRNLCLMAGHREGVVDIVSGQAHIRAKGEKVIEFEDFRAIRWPGTAIFVTFTIGLPV